jgi:hypothetical protein
MCVRKEVNSNIIETSYGDEKFGILSSFDGKRLIDKFENGIQK